jgi:uncharacterized UPF0160 family protein
MVRILNNQDTYMSNITIATHDGTFHADEVFAIAILKLIYTDISIIRSRDPEKFNKADIIIDIGGKYDANNKFFDHHMTEGAGTRPNDIPYAACGLIWKHYGKELAPSKIVYDNIERSIIQSIDAIDTGYSMDDNFNKLNQYTVSDIIDGFNPPWYDEEISSDTAFEQAISFAEKILKNKLNHALGIKKAATYVREAILNTIDPRYVVLDKYCPWQDIVLEESDALFVAFPASPGDWRVRAVPLKKGSFQLKQPLPKEWAGKTLHEMPEITGVADATFCHRSCFIAGAKSREGAIALIKLALDS